MSDCIMRSTTHYGQPRCCTCQYLATCPRAQAATFGEAPRYWPPTIVPEPWPPVQVYPQPYYEPNPLVPSLAWESTNIVQDNFRMWYS